jgi:hypothetical protein
VGEELWTGYVGCSGLYIPQELFLSSPTHPFREGRRVSGGVG